MKVRCYYSKVLYAKEHEYRKMEELARKPWYHPVESHYLLTYRPFCTSGGIGGTSSFHPSLMSGCHPSLMSSHHVMSITTRHPLRKVSFSYVSDQFARCVDRMESVILVPTKLQDICIQGDPSIPFLISSGHKTLFDIYHMLIKFRDKLQTVADRSTTSSTTTSFPSASTTPLSGSVMQENIVGQPPATPDDLLERELTPFNVEESNAIYSFNPSLTKNCSSSSHNNGSNNYNTRVTTSLSSSSSSLSRQKDFCDSGFWSSSSSSSSAAAESVTLSVLTPDGSHDQEMVINLTTAGLTGDDPQRINQSNRSPSSASQSISMTSFKLSSPSTPLSSTSSPTSLSPSTVSSLNCSSSSSSTTSDNHTSSSTSTTCYVVKKSLHSAKGLCAFLVELSQVTYYVIDRYLEEMDCQFCE